MSALEWELTLCRWIVTKRTVRTHTSVCRNAVIVKSVTIP